jgi:hypothetical protein
LLFSSGATVYFLRRDPSTGATVPWPHELRAQKIDNGSGSKVETGQFGLNADDGPHDFCIYVRNESRHEFIIVTVLIDGHKVAHQSVKKERKVRIMTDEGNFFRIGETMDEVDTEAARDGRQCAENQTIVFRLAPGRSGGRKTFTAQETGEVVKSLSAKKQRLDKKGTSMGVTEGACGGGEKERRPVGSKYTTNSVVAADGEVELAKVHYNSDFGLTANHMADPAAEAAEAARKEAEKNTPQPLGPLREARMAKRKEKERLERLEKERLEKQAVKQEAA